MVQFWVSGQRIVGVTAHVRSPCRRHNDVIAGIMLGAFTVQLKDQLSLHLGTSGFNTIMQCAATGP